MIVWNPYLCLFLALVLAGCAGPTRQGHDTYPMTINGITFQEKSAGLGCPEPLQDATEGQVAASPINFSLDYLPEAYTLQQEMASTCQGNVVSLGKIATGPQGVINVARWNTRITRVPPQAPAPINVAGRQGVIFGTASGTTVILAESFGMTEVTVDTLDRSEVLRIVEGIR